MRTMLVRRSVLTGMALVGLLAFGAPQARAQSDVQQIKSKGVLTVGVKADYPPFGFRQPDGQIVGIEPDLARDIAKRLGVRAEFVPVLASNRIQFLQQGRIDLLIATMNDTPERAKLVDIVHPDYYASGYNLMLPKSMNVTSWDQVKGKPVCAIQGAVYNKPAAEKFSFELSAFAGQAEALTAMEQGRCVGLLYDDTAIEGQLAKSQWSGYDMPLPSQDAQPWGIAVKLGNTGLAQQVSDAIKAWEKDGTILSLETKYGLKHHSPFAQQAHDAAKG
jgi:polar amino acid transport system substrate-binding protein